MLTRAKYMGDGKPGNVIKEIRKSKGMTMKQVSNISGVSESAISRYENDSRTPTIGVYLRILEALGADLYIMHD